MKYNSAKSNYPVAELVEALFNGNNDYAIRQILLSRMPLRQAQWPMAGCSVTALRQAQWPVAGCSVTC